MNANSTNRRPIRRPNYVGRAVTRKLKALHLNSEPNWHLVRNSPDPPPYDVDVSYQRKIRIVTNLSATGSHIVNYAQLLQALFGTASNPFTRMLVTRIAAWAPAAAGSFIGLTPDASTIQGGGLAAKQYSDRGTQGSVRPHVCIVVSPKDANWNLISSNTPLCTVTGLNSHEVILDFTVSLSGLAQATKVF